MKSMKNKVQLIGNLGATPEIKEFQKGKKVATFSVATNDWYYDAQNNKVNDTQWHHLVAWGKTAEKAQKFLEKGTEILLEGRLVNRSYTDASGNKRHTTEVVVNDFTLLSSKKN